MNKTAVARAAVGNQCRVPCVAAVEIRSTPARAAHCPGVVYEDTIGRGRVREIPYKLCGTAACIGDRASIVYESGMSCGRSDAHYPAPQ